MKYTVLGFLFMISCKGSPQISKEPISEKQNLREGKSQSLNLDSL